jgi:hypothetical protein
LFCSEKRLGGSLAFPHFAADRVYEAGEAVGCAAAHLHLVIGIIETVDCKLAKKSLYIG